MGTAKEVVCKEVVITTNSARGRGVIGSPFRTITEVWEKDGTKIAENDPCPEVLTYWDAIHFARWCQSAERPDEPLGMKMLEKWLEATSPEPPKP